ncbi:hypothetical protein [[Clostridium] aminophilum]|uniref:hypothetical protein n=1 Tax=[Clostridium] aminophilum TaxID=1526 RepID=UPI00332C8B77
MTHSDKMYREKQKQLEAIVVDIMDRNPVFAEAQTEKQKEQYYVPMESVADFISEKEDDAQSIEFRDTFFDNVLCTIESGEITECSDIDFLNVLNKKTGKQRDYIPQYLAQKFYV